MYTIIEINQRRTGKMCDAVQAMMSEGWEPQGGIAMTLDRNGFIVYAQAMVKVEPVEVRSGEMQIDPQAMEDALARAFPEPGPGCTCVIVGEVPDFDCPAHGIGV